MIDPLRRHTPGPFRAEHLREDDRYELSNGHPIYCAPAGREHAAPNLTGAAVIDSDPAVEWAGVDAGFTPAPGILRAPDIAVAASSGEDATGWIPGAPPLAVEYAGRGQDEQELRDKIAELLAAGTRFIWVARLRGPQRVEVYRPNMPMKTYTAGDMLEAPGVLRNPVPVRALFDREAAHEAVLKNLLQRRGYASLNEVHEEGREEGREEGLIEAILALLQGRGLAVNATAEAQLRACHDREILRRWLLCAVRVERAEQLFDAE
jgi:Uma2 family endonuclease